MLISFSRQDDESLMCLYCRLTKKEAETKKSSISSKTVQLINGNTGGWDLILTPKRPPGIPQAVRELVRGARREALERTARAAPRLGPWHPASPRLAVSLTPECAT